MKQLSTYVFRNPFCSKMENSKVCKFCATESMESPLMTAIRFSHVQCLKELIAAGADVNEGTDKHTPVTLALRPRGYEADRQCLDLLVDAGVDLNAQQTVSGDTPLMYICQEDTKVKLLICKGADVNARKGDGSTALMLAAEDGIYKSVKLLLEAGADVNAQDSNGATPLHYAASGFVVNAPSCNQCKAFCYPAIEGTDQCTQLMLSARADVNLLDGYDRTALMMAVYTCNVKCLDLLIKSGSDVNEVDRDGSTALMAAAGLHVLALYEVLPRDAIKISKNALSCCKLLLKAGARINVVSSANYTSLKWNQENSRKVPENMQYMYIETHRLLSAAGENQWAPGVYFNQVPDLKIICRGFIRHHLLCLDQHCNLFSRIPLLGFPSTIQAYLLLNTSFDIDED